MSQEPTRPTPGLTPGRTAHEAAQDEAPPFLGSWRNVYALLVAELGLLVVLFYALARWAS